MDDAVSKKDFNEYFLATVRFIDTVSSTTTTNWEEVPWYETINAFAESANLNNITKKFPILDGKKEKNEPLPWEYDGRSWYFWANLFSINYGWRLDEISLLDIDDALGLYQEIVIDDQMQKEWQWGLSEISYPYNQSSKKQEFKPLARPNWMLPIAPTPKIVKLRKDMLPMGTIIDLSEVAKKHGI